MIIQCQGINALLQRRDPSFLSANNLTAEFFSDYRKEYDYITEHIARYGNVPDQATFLSAFPNFDVVEVHESNEYLVDQLYEDRNKRQLAKTFNAVRDLLTADKVDEAVALYTSAANQVIQSKKIKVTDILRDTSRYDDYVERINNFSKYYVKTGFTELDALLGGWDRQEELATLAARPGVGKSWLLLKVAIAAAQQGLTVGIYSGEMSERKVGYRADTLISHIANSKIMRGDGDVQVEYRKFLDKVANDIPGSLKVITPQSIGGLATVSSLKAFIEQEHLDMLCVDQHSLLEDERKGKTPVEKAANISRDLKALQVMMKIPIIAVSQQNRESVENGVTTANIAQSDRISQDSTVIIFISQKDDVLTLTLAKARDAASGKELKYAIDLNRGIFNYIPVEGEGTGSAEQCEDLRTQFESDNYVPDDMQEGDDVLW